MTTNHCPTPSLARAAALATVVAIATAGLPSALHAQATSPASPAAAPATPATPAPSAKTPAPRAAMAVDPEAAAAAIAVATRFLDRFDAGDFAAARADFDATMQRGLDVAMLTDVGGKLAGAGAIVERRPATVTLRDGYRVVVIPVQREKAVIDTTVAVDADGNVAGVFFTPAQGGNAE